MKKTSFEKIVLTLILVLLGGSAFAYIGPGMTGGVFAATIGIIVALVAALFGLVWFPVKKLLKKRREKTALESDK